MRIIEFLHYNFQTEQPVNLTKVLQLNRFASYYRNLNTKAAKEVMLENINPKSGKGIWILRPEWRKPLDKQVKDQIINEMTEWKMNIRDINDRKEEKKLKKFKSIAKFAKEEHAKSVVMEGDQIKIEW